MPKTAKNRKKKSAAVFGDYLIMLSALCVVSVYCYGKRALLVLASGVLTAAFCDLVGGLLFYNKILLKDLCAVFTGAAIALMMPSTVPLYIPALASAFAILVVKIPFGGAFKAPVVPACAGFAFTTVCFPGEIFSFPTQAMNLTGQFVSGTSLAGLLQKSSSLHIDAISAFDILTGTVSGPMGTCCAAVLLGCLAFLLIRRPTAFISAISFIVTCCVISLIFPRVNTGAAASLIMEICSGSLLFAAVFFVTDPATSPSRSVGCLIYGCFAGILCMLARHFGIYEEGVCFAVILANCAAPLVQRLAHKIESAILASGGKGAAQ